MIKFSIFIFFLKIFNAPQNNYYGNSLTPECIETNVEKTVYRQIINRNQNPACKPNFGHPKSGAKTNTSAV